MDFSIQNSFRTMGVTPANTDAKGRATTNVVDLDPTAIVEQFAKMLVAQISNQDPDNAMDPTQIITQYSQMTSSLGLAKLTNQQGFYEHIRLASSVVGKTVSYIDPNDPTGGIVLTGTVTAADFTEAKPAIEINGTDSVPMDNLVMIYQ
jgi:flagellar hook assembly protein FlgD